MQVQEKISVVIADEQAVYRDGLRMLLLDMKMFSLKGETADNAGLIKLVKKYSPQMAILDLQCCVKEGVPIIKKLLMHNRSLKILVLSENDELVGEAFTAGAKGYISKNLPQQAIRKAIRAVASGEQYCLLSDNRNYAAILLRKLKPVMPKKKILLNAKEQRMLTLLCNDRTTKQISEEMHVSKRTLDRIRTRLKDKLDVKNAAGMVLYAIRSGIFQLDI